MSSPDEVMSYQLASAEALKSDGVPSTAAGRELVRYFHMMTPLPESPQLYQRLVYLMECMAREAARQVAFA